MTPLVAGLVLMIAVHLVPTVPGLRARLRERLGVPIYATLFSLVSLAALALVVWGYGEARRLPVASNPQLWMPPSWGRHVTMLLMLPAMIALVATAVPSRVRDVLKHPLLVAIKLWALGHLFVRGDLAALLLFGSLLAFAIYDRISVKRRGAESLLGSKRGNAMGDVVVIVGGLLLYALFLTRLHVWLIGVPILR